MEIKGRRRWEENEEGDGKKTWKKKKKKKIGRRESVRMCVAMGIGGPWAKN